MHKSVHPFILANCVVWSFGGRGGEKNIVGIRMLRQVSVVSDELIYFNREALGPKYPIIFYCQCISSFTR